MKFDKTQKRALVFVAGLLGLSWYMGNQFEKADMMRSEADGYAYAYNEGHSDSRKDEDYQPTLESGREEARFRKILKQRAEALARDWKWKGVGWTPEEEATLSREEKEAVAEQLYNDWRAGKIEATDVDEYYERLENNAESYGDETFETSDYEKLEYIHSTLQDCEGDDGMIEISLGFVEELREPYFDYTDINGKPYPKNLIYYQPDLSDEWDVIGGDSPIHSFEVFKSKKLVEELFPDSEIMEMSGNDVEHPSFIDEEFSAETFNAPYAGSGSLMNIGQDTSLGNFTSKELTESSAIHGDFNEASLNYSGHQNLQVRGAETMTPSEVKVKVTKDVTPKGSKIIVEECVDIQAHKADATANFYRVRFRDPADMSNFRVPAWAARAANTMGSKYYDVAGSKVTMGQDKSGNWKIQSVMVPKRANVDVDLALKIANHIQDRLEKEGRWASKKCQDNERVLIIR